MPPCRVFILTSHPLFAEGVEQLLHEQPGLEVVGLKVVGPDAFESVRQASPDVVVVSAPIEEQGGMVAQVLEQNPGVKAIGLTLEDNRIHIYYQQEKLGRRVEDLVEAIRQPLDWRGARPAAMRILAVVRGRYGQRIVENLRRYAPSAWTIESWRAPSVLPPIVDDPQRVLPHSLPAADLVLSLGESPSVAQLLPDIVRRCGAQALIAPVDNVAWLPEGLIRQLEERLHKMDTVAVFPRPFCSLTEDGYNLRHQRVALRDPWIAEFARHFGRPAFDITTDGETILQVELERDSACGCARAVAEQLVGTELSEAVLQAGLFHHHYPCLATMQVDPGLGEPLIQASGNLLREAVEVELKSYPLRGVKPGE